MASWYPADERRPSLGSLLLGVLVWLLLVLAVYGALRFAAWNGAR